MKDSDPSRLSGVEFTPGAERRSLWYAPLLPAKFRLLKGLFFKEGDVYSAETYQEIAADRNMYARVNLLPHDSCLWTVVVGKLDIINRYANHDHVPPGPLTNIGAQLGEDKLISVDELALAAPSVFQPEEAEPLHYYVRPSSFALSRVAHTMLFGQETKITTWRYRLSESRSHEFFAHIHTEDESTWLLPFCRALLATNSQTYIWNHAELDYTLLHPSQSAFIQEFV